MVAMLASATACTLVSNPALNGEDGTTDASTTGTTDASTTDASTTDASTIGTTDASATGTTDAIAGTSSGGASSEDTADPGSTGGVPMCGNDVREGDEDCDGSLGPEVTCATAGFTEGTISCDTVTCQYDTSGCSLCGNGIVEGTEPCDSDDLGGLTCTDLGYTSGTLACSVGTCDFDPSRCTASMYTQGFEGGVIPNEFDGSGSAEWLADGGNPIAGSFSAASGVITNAQTTSLTLTATYPAGGTVAFTHAESSEAFDSLTFYVDGVVQQAWSGINAAQMASFPVGPGPHLFEWRYAKDGSVSAGLDRVWVDDIVLTGGIAG